MRKGALFAPLFLYRRKYKVPLLIFERKRVFIIRGVSVGNSVREGAAAVAVRLTEMSAAKAN